MGKIVSVKINNWSGGIVNDGRSKRSNVAKTITNAEVLKNPYRVTPFFESERGATNEATDLMQNWCLGNAAGTYKLYGLCRQDANDRVRILYKNLTTGSTNDLSNDDWTETANNAAGQNTPDYNLFVFYKRTGYIYGGHTGTHIWRYDPDGGDAFADTHQALTYTFLGQGVVHSKDDILYIPYFNAGGFIAKNNNGTWSTTALTLPSDMKPVSICEYGNYLAIGCANISGIGGSKVYIWNRDSSLATLSENYDLPEGTLTHLEYIGGTLVAILQTGGSTLGGQGVSDTVRFRAEILFYTLTPSGFVLEKRLENSTGSSLKVGITKQKLNGRMYFPMAITIHGLLREGTWSYGLNEKGEWVLIHERTPDNDTATQASVLRGFFYVGDYLFQAFVNASGSHEVSKTKKDAYVNQTTIYESVINPNMPEEDLFKNKQLKAVIVRYVALPTAGQVVLKQRTDSTTAWTSITAAFTETTDSALVTEMVSNGATQFTAGREIEFRLESTGGAEILELAYQYETLETLI